MPKLVRVPEAAELLSISPKTLWAYVAARKIDTASDRAIGAYPNRIHQSPNRGRHDTGASRLTKIKRRQMRCHAGAFKGSTYEQR